MTTTGSRVWQWLLARVAPSRTKLAKHWSMMESDQSYRENVLNLLHARGYVAGSSGKLQATWSDAAARSPDAELWSSLPVMRNRSRLLRRSDGLGAAIIRLFTRKVVGTGLTFQHLGEDRERATEIERAVRMGTRNIDPANGLPYGLLQSLRYQAMNEAGAVFIVRSRDPMTGALITETVEAERVDYAPGQDPVRTVMGVERSDSGVPVAYWIRRGYPGETVGVRPIDSTVYDRVPAERVYHLRRFERPGTTREEPLLAPVLLDVRDASLFALAAMKRMQIASCLAAFIRTPAPPDQFLDLTAEKYGYTLDQQIQPVSITKLYPGEEMQFLSPNYNSSDVEPMLKIYAQRAGAALGVSWQSIMREWLGSYSAARTQVLEDRPTYAIERVRLEGMLNWEADAVLEDAVMRGDLRAGDDIFDPELRQWVPDAEEWLDPVSDAQATEIKLDRNLTTQRAVVARLGGDWEEVARQRIRERVLEEMWETEIRDEFGVGPAVAEGTDGAEVDASDPEAPAAPGVETPEGTDAVQDTALNGAQVTALLEIVTAVVEDRLPKETASAVILAAFPTLNPTAVEAMLAPAETFEPAEPEPPPMLAPGAAPPPPAPSGEPEEETEEEEVTA